MGVKNFPAGTDSKEMGFAGSSDEVAGGWQGVMKAGIEHGRGRSRINIVLWCSVVLGYGCSAGGGLWLLY